MWRGGGGQITSHCIGYVVRDLIKKEGKPHPPSSPRMVRKDTLQRGKMGVVKGWEGVGGN